MSKRGVRIVADATRASQAMASDPSNSVWVSAHAGSGKTHVLSQRVIRLLLQETDPSRILCLTYTRAAAANMSKRVFEDLAKWTELSDSELSQRIGAIEGAKPSRADLARARTLFATALETPGGLKVQTIHAFCESVLHQFPLEANIAAHFQMLDTRMEAALVAEARRDMISGAAGGGSPALTEAFATILNRAGEFGLDILLGEIVGKRDRLRAFIEAADDGSQRFRGLFDELGLRADEDAESIANQVWPLPGFPPDIFAAFAAIAQREAVTTVRDRILPDAIAGFSEADPVERLLLLASGFLKADGDPYDTGKTFTRIAKFMPDVVERYTAAASTLIDATERLALWRMADGTRAALIVADRLIDRYEDLKASRGFLDFNDLILRTHRLLSRADAGAWVQYKLDQGIDHILIDEAQDTSSEQWAVVHALAAEFFVGEGARGNMNRTIFAVGDEKQSIYSFQGASPDAFGHSGDAFANAVRLSGKPFERVELKQSFRSTRDVLYAVDQIFSDEETRRGVASDAFTHDTTRVGDPGYVELWPYIGADSITEPEDWRQGIDHAKAPAVRVAEQVANTIRDWVRGHALLEGQNRHIKPGDIMVLVRKRDRFVHALSRALKVRQIPVAGADRLLLASHIAVKDLIALGRVLIQREDDLSLAAILKSPLFGLSEDQLFHLASDRKGQSLYQRLSEKARCGDALLAGIEKQLQDWAVEAAFKPPFEFYARVLGRDQGRRRFIGRLGHEAGEILDEFLTYCLAEESVGMAGLEELLTTLETAGPEIKREMDQGRNEVRILTVHASKGLEAPIVFLVDSGAEPAIDAHLPRLTPFKPTSEMLQGVEAYLWRSSKDVSNTRSKNIERELRRLNEEEYRRLLYVGMTRAEDRLVLCGYYNVRKPRSTTWLSIAETALAAAPEAQTLPHPVGEGEVLRFRVTPQRAVEAPKRDKDESEQLALVPTELTGRLTARENLPRPLTPSGAALLIEEGDEPAPMRRSRSPVLDADDATASALDRGRVVHKLLQVLPDINLDERQSAMTRYLGFAAGNWPPAERASVELAVGKLLNDAQFAPVFAPGSAAEVPIAGTLTVKGRPRVVSGIIDRLAVTDERVLIVDYKTNRPPPEALADVPLAYILQLALYAELLKPIYPGRRVEAALLFTESMQLMDLPQEVLGSVLARLTEA